MATNDQDRVMEYRLVQEPAVPDVDPQLRSNCMIWGLPPLQTASQTFRALAVRARRRSSDFAELPLHVRLAEIDNTDDFHYPFPLEEKLFQKILVMVRKSYLYRDPADPRVMKVIMETASGQFRGLPRLAPVGSSAGGMLLTGISGAGKTSFLKRVAELLGTTPWCHYSLNGEPCRWFQLGVINVKAKDTWKGTLQEILSAIDRQLKSQYWSVSQKGATRAGLEGAVVAALTSHMVPLLIIDDIDQITPSHKDAQKILNGLVNFMEASGIPVLVTGTVAVRNLFSSFPMEHAKLSSTGAFSFTQLKHEDENTAAFLGTWKDSSVSLRKISYVDNFDELLILFTCGVRRVIRDFMKAIFERHANDETVVANKELLSSISENECVKYREALSFMRKAQLGWIDADNMAAARYEHFLPPDRPKATAETKMTLQAMAMATGKSVDALRSQHMSAEEMGEWQSRQATLKALATAKKAGKEAKGGPPPGRNDSGVK